MGKFSAIRFIKDQWTDLELASADLTGKTVIVTGANIGLGFETAKHLARMKPEKLILACRDSRRAKEAMNQIRAQTKIGDELVAWNLDLSSFSSVIAFVKKFETEGGGRLDLLIENAGIATGDYRKTEDGWERIIQINHLSTALLALLLLPIQMRTAESGPTPRLVILSSEGHYFLGPVDLEDSSNPKILEKLSNQQYATPARMTKQYNISKLLNVFFTRSLSAHLPPSRALTVVSVNPGLCHSSLTRNTKGLVSLAVKSSKLIFARTTEMGSRTIVWGALGGENGAVHGRYLESCRVSEESDWALGSEGQVMQDNVWRETLEILKKVDPRVQSIVTEYLTPQCDHSPDVPI